jgi:hypothetical protein
MNMSNEPEDVRQARQLFDECVERLDAATLSRLNRQRRTALAALDGRAATRWQLWLPATGVVAAVTMSLLLWQRDGAPLVPPVDAAADLDILIADENLEMLEELEFYAWLESEQAEPAPDDPVG